MAVENVDELGRILMHVEGAAPAGKVDSQALITPPVDSAFALTTRSKGGMRMTESASPGNNPYEGSVTGQFLCAM
jgi:hypothetical protein